jgi:hypothetical protein
MGLTSTSFIVSIQSTVNWEQRGIATAANMFMRNLGNTVGAALLGGILNSQIYDYIKASKVTNHLTVDSTNFLLNEQQRNHLPADVRSVLQEALTTSLHSVYFGVFLFAIFTFILVLFLPKKTY